MTATPETAVERTAPFTADQMDELHRWLGDVVDSYRPLGDPVYGGDPFGLIEASGQVT